MVEIYLKFLRLLVIFAFKKKEIEKKLFKGKRDSFKNFQMQRKQKNVKRIEFFLGFSSRLFNRYVHREKNSFKSNKFVFLKLLF